MSKHNKYILSIDMGTSGPKSALVSVTGEVVDYEFQEVKLHLFPNGGAEQDPNEWWQAVLNTSKRVIQKGLVPPEDIVAVCCSAHWAGTIAVDPDGNHLMNAIMWLDSRGSKYVKDITDGFFKVEGYNLRKLHTWIRLTGGAPSQSGKDSLAHILYIKHEHPDIYKKTAKFLEPVDYLNLKFTGKMAASTNSIALHWLTDNRNLSKVDYNPHLLKLATLERDKFPDLKRSSVDILGPIKSDVAKELGLKNDVQVVMGTPDVPCAAIGSGAVKDYEAHLYIGTSSWITCHVPFKKTDLFHNMASLPSAIPDKYFIATSQETAGACLTYLRDNIIYHKDALLEETNVPNVYKVFDQIVSKIPAGSDKVIFTPWLYGERTPVENPSVRAGIFNQTLSTTREHLVRAVFEGVAYNSKWLFGYVEKFIKRRIESIHMIGGGANSNAWCQIHADVLNRTIKQVKNPIQANMRGTAFLASVALGYLTFDQIPDHVEIANTYTPNPDHRNIYDELSREFLNIYKVNKKIYARLNKVNPVQPSA